MRVSNLFALLMLLAPMTGCTQTAKPEGGDKFSDVPEDAFNFILASDLGRNGFYDQPAVAAEMGATAERIDIEFVAAAGDTFHYIGVQSTGDPLWMTNYESVYNHPELQIEWYPVAGNHEYQGNVGAVIEYSAVSRRWNMPARYYTRVHEVDDDVFLRMVHIDTAPLIDKYRGDDEYSDAGRQDMELQLRWIDSVLESSTEQWKIVVGHHPVYADTEKDDEERNDMQARLDPILKRHGVDMYLCGHIHNFQHIHRTDSDVDYIVNSSGSQSRTVAPVEGTQFCSPLTGFSVVSATPDSLKLYMLDKNAALLHTVRRGK